MAGLAKVRQGTIAAYFARLDLESVRVFLRKYDAYYRELKPRTLQMV